MILADRLKQALLASKKKFSTHGNQYAEHCDPVLAILEDSHKFVFTEKIGKMAEDAAVAPEKIAQFITLPYKNTWIEFVGSEDQRFGVLTNCPNPDRLWDATAIIVTPEPRSGEIRFDAGEFNLRNGGFDEFVEIAEDRVRRYIGAITLMGAPDLLEKKPVIRDKLNKHRLKKGSVPLVNHDIVNLYLTKHERDLEEEADRHERAGNSGGSGHHKRRHFVRAHIRILPDGKVTKVRPHYRGDDSLGPPARTHIVRV